MFDVAVKSVQTEIVETETQFEQRKLIVLEGGFSTGDGTYRFELNSDGTGRIIYPDCFDESEEFFHETEVKKLARKIEEAVAGEVASHSEIDALGVSEIENVRCETVAEILEEVFWAEINQRLEDPFFRSFEDESEWGEEFCCERGTTEEFIEFLKLSVLTEREIKDAEGLLIVEAETDFDTAGLIEGSYYTERLGELVEIACKYYQPSGFNYSYNDGCYDRMSGYSMSSETISVSLAEFARVPSREQMLGMIELRRKLTVMEVEGEKLERLTSF